ncbi:hypothetical protein JCM10213_006041 [Rhodosporidiobolus nylandii]
MQPSLEGPPLPRPSRADLVDELVAAVEAQDAPGTAQTLAQMNQRGMLLALHGKDGVDKPHSWKGYSALTAAATAPWTRLSQFVLDLLLLNLGGDPMKSSAGEQERSKLQGWAMKVLQGWEAKGRRAATAARAFLKLALDEQQSWAYAHLPPPPNPRSPNRALTPPPPGVAKRPSSPTPPLLAGGMTQLPPAPDDLFPSPSPAPNPLSISPAPPSACSEVSVLLGRIAHSYSAEALRKVLPPLGGLLRLEKAENGAIVAVFNGANSARAGQLLLNNLPIVGVRLTAGFASPRTSTLPSPIEPATSASLSPIDPSSALLTPISPAIPFRPSPRPAASIPTASSSTAIPAPVGTSSPAEQLGTAVLPLAASAAALQPLGQAVFTPPGLSSSSAHPPGTFAPSAKDDARYDQPVTSVSSGVVPAKRPRPPPASGSTSDLPLPTPSAQLSSGAARRSGNANVAKEDPQKTLASPSLPSKPEDGELPDDLGDADTSLDSGVGLSTSVELDAYERERKEAEAKGKEDDDDAFFDVVFSRGPDDEAVASPSSVIGSDAGGREGTARVAAGALLGLGIDFGESGEVEKANEVGGLSSSFPSLATPVFAFDDPPEGVSAPNETALAPAPPISAHLPFALPHTASPASVSSAPSRPPRRIAPLPLRRTPSSSSPYPSPEPSPPLTARLLSPPPPAFALRPSPPPQHEQAPQEKPRPTKEEKGKARAVSPLPVEAQEPAEPEAPPDANPFAGIFGLLARPAARLSPSPTLSIFPTRASSPSVSSTTRPRSALKRPASRLRPGEADARKRRRVSWRGDPFGGKELARVVGEGAGHVEAVYVDEAELEGMEEGEIEGRMEVDE